MGLYHLASQVLADKAPGEFVELGSYLGQSTVLIAKVIEEYGPHRRLHVYDAFMVQGSIGYWQVKCLRSE
ncbi:MAG: hypothetical protein ACJASY_002363 [Halioglobus sp.]|jgi:hypothetical protein